MKLSSMHKKLIGNEDERAVSPVIGVILMVAITVILAAVIAAFVLDIGPGDTDPTASVEVSNNGTDEVGVALISYDSGNTDGIAVVADEDIDESNFDEGDVVATLDTTGEETTITSGDLDGPEPDGDYDMSVRAFSGEVDSGHDQGAIGDQADSQAIVETFTFSEPE